MSEQDHITSAEVQVTHLDALEALVRKLAREEIAKAFEEMKKTAMFNRECESFGSPDFNTLTLVADLVDYMDLEEVE